MYDAKTGKHAAGNLVSEIVTISDIDETYHGSNWELHITYQRNDGRAFKMHFYNLRGKYLLEEFMKHFPKDAILRNGTQLPMVFMDRDKLVGLGEKTDSYISIKPDPRHYMTIE